MKYSNNSVTKCTCSVIPSMGAPNLLENFGWQFTLDSYNEYSWLITTALGPILHILIWVVCGTHDSMIVSEKAIVYFSL